MMRQWGASADDLALAKQIMNAQQEAADLVEIWPENWDLWQLFMKVSELWVRVGMAGQRTALDWPAVEVVARGLGHRRRRWREVVEALLVVQDEVLQVDRKLSAAA